MPPGTEGMGRRRRTRGQGSRRVAPSTGGDRPYLSMRANHDRFTNQGWRRGWATCMYMYFGHLLINIIFWIFFCLILLMRHLVLFLQHFQPLDSNFLHLPLFFLSLLPLLDACRCLFCAQFDTFNYLKYLGHTFFIFYSFSDGAGWGRIVG